MPQKCPYTGKPLNNIQIELYNTLFSPMYKTDKRDINMIRLFNPSLATHFESIQPILGKLEKQYRSETIEVGGKRFYMVNNIQKILDHFIRSNKKKWDFVCLITGIEGSAKTTFAKCIAWYLTKKFKKSNKFTNDNIVFTPKEFYDAVDKAKPGECILWDEFVMAGMSTDMGAIQNAIIKKFTIIRKKQLFIILVIPFIWMLRSYFAIARTKLLINVYSPDFIRRGFYAVWGYNRKKHLYFRGTMTGTKWSYKSVDPSFHGTFLKDIAQPNFFTDDKEYEHKKDMATKKIGVGKTAKEKEKEKEEKLKKEGGLVNKVCEECKSRRVWFYPKEKKWECQLCGWVKSTGTKKA